VCVCLGARARAHTGHVAIWWLKILIYILEIQVLNLGSSDWGSSSPSMQMLEFFNVGHDRLLYRQYQFTMHNHSVIQHYVTGESDKRVIKQTKERQSARNPRQVWLSRWRCMSMIRSTNKIIATRRSKFISQARHMSSVRYIMIPINKTSPSFWILQSKILSIHRPSELIYPAINRLTCVKSVGGSKTV